MECANEPIAIQKAIQDHLNSIFHYSETNQLYLSMKCKGSLPNITNVGEIEIKHKNVDPQFLTNVLTTYPDHYTISVVSRIVGEIPKESPFFQIQNIQVMFLCGPDYFHNFVGRNMRLDWVVLTDQDLIQVLQKWISNEAYENLVSLSLSIANTINADLIRQTIEFEEYDPNESEKRPADYVIDIPYTNFFNHKYSLKEAFVEIKRITDGKRAFLSVGATHFDLLVDTN
ncbi:hypothetical protein B9Z55_016692 [Caenorhabditis nigoni]|nr:hypothetical protein B9Z55_016692 [Caenorhabditis nigoni]